MSVDLHPDRKLKTLETWLRCESADALSQLFAHADEVRQERFGSDTCSCGLVEISNNCRRRCLYCGLNLGNHAVVRYRMTVGEVMDSLAHVAELGCSGVILQGGEDGGLNRQDVAEVIERAGGEFGLSVTLSLGEREYEELNTWREAGAERYLLRFETSDEGLLHAIHPPFSGSPGRFETLKMLRDLGYRVGSGVMVGLPGQNYVTLAQDVFLFEELKLDMVSVDPFLPHPGTLLGQASLLEFDDQVPADIEMVHKVLALTRILCPDASILASMVFDVADPDGESPKALGRGANVTVSNCTPPCSRTLYEAYPRVAMA